MLLLSEPPLCHPTTTAAASESNCVQVHNINAVILLLDARVRLSVTLLLWSCMILWYNVVEMLKCC